MFDHSHSIGKIKSVENLFLGKRAIDRQRPESCQKKAEEKSSNGGTTHVSRPLSCRHLVRRTTHEQASLLLDMRVERLHISGLFKSLKCLFLVRAGLGSCLLPVLTRLAWKWATGFFHIPAICNLSTLISKSKDACTRDADELSGKEDVVVIVKNCGKSGWRRWWREHSNRLMEKRSFRTTGAFTLLEVQFGRKSESRWEDFKERDGAFH